MTGVPIFFFVSLLRVASSLLPEGSTYLFVSFYPLACLLFICLGRRREEEREATREGKKKKKKKKKQEPVLRVYFGRNELSAERERERWLFDSTCCEFSSNLAVRRIHSLRILIANRGFVGKSERGRGKGRVGGVGEGEGGGGGDRLRSLERLDGVSVNEKDLIAVRALTVRNTLVTFLLLY